jgi:uracil-DNA glycosylase
VLAPCPVATWTPATSATSHCDADIDARVGARSSIGYQSVMDRSKSAALPYLPSDHSLVALASAIGGCKGCEICPKATAPVFGEGPAHARLVFVGEQPGDEEDRKGRPFIGPAGQVFDQALAEAEIPRDTVYVTNAVKAFKWEPRGKRRIHSKPTYSEIRACNAWLTAEIEAISPSLVVCLGVSAASAFAGSGFTLSKGRGRIHAETGGPPWIATFHPSAVLRAETDTQRKQTMGAIVEDLRLAKVFLQEAPRLADG